MTFIVKLFWKDLTLAKHDKYYLNYTPVPAVLKVVIIINRTVTCSDINVLSS